MPGKRANLTVLDKNPLSVDPAAIRDIKVWGTVMEGRVLPAGQTRKDASLAPASLDPQGDPLDFAKKALGHALTVVHTHV